MDAGATGTAVVRSASGLAFASGLEILARRISLEPIARFYRQNSGIVWYLCIVAILVYGFELFQFNFSIDEEVHAFDASATRAWIALGRWGMYLLNYFILPYTSVPIVPLATALFLAISGIVLVMRVWGSVLRLDHFVASALVLSFPTISFNLAFSLNSYGIGAGFLAVGLACHSISKGGTVHNAFAVLLLAFATAVYQSLILTVVPIYFSLVLLRALADAAYGCRLILRDMVTIGLIIAGALVVYAAINYAFLAMFKLTTAPYMESFVRIGELLRSPMAVLRRTLGAVYSAYSGTADFFVQAIRTTGVLYCSSMAIVAWMIVKARRPILDKTLLLTLTSVVLLSPFIMHLANGGSMPARTLLAVPYSVAAAVFVALTWSSGLMRVVLVVLSTYVIFQFSVNANRLFNATHIALQADRALAHDIVREFERLQARSDRKIEYIEIVGSHDWPTNDLILHNDIFGASFFSWDGGNPIRGTAFLRSMGLPNLRSVEGQKRAEVVSDALKMPSWPLDNSIAVVGDVLVVKLGDYSAFQKRVICQQTFVPAICPTK